MNAEAIQMHMQQPGPMAEIVRQLKGAARAERVSIGGMIEAVGDTSFLPVLITPALLVVSPLSGIPVFSSICGLTIAFVAAQMLTLRSHVWLPGVLTRRTISGKRARGAIKRLDRVAGWIDRHATGHGAWAMRAPVRMICVIACLIAGLSMPFLELLPFSSSLLGLSVILFSVAILARDALFMGFGAAVMTGAMSIPFYAWTKLSGL